MAARTIPLATHLFPPSFSAAPVGTGIPVVPPVPPVVPVVLPVVPPVVPPFPGCVPAAGVGAPDSGTVVVRVGALPIAVVVPPPALVEKGPQLVATPPPAADDATTQKDVTPSVGCGMKVEHCAGRDAVPPTGTIHWIGTVGWGWQLAVTVPSGPTTAQPNTEGVRSSSSHAKKAGYELY